MAVLCDHLYNSKGSEYYSNRIRRLNLYFNPQNILNLGTETKDQIKHPTNVRCGDLIFSSKVKLGCLFKLFLLNRTMKVRLNVHT